MRLEDAAKKLSELEKAREELLKLVRELRINATKAVAAVHSGEDVESHMQKARELLAKVVEYKRYPEIYYSIAHEALQELVEAIAFIAAVRGNFDFEIDADVEASSLVTGLADAIGELRRYTLSKLVEGNFSEAERLMRLMEEMYSKLIPLTALPDKLVPGLRHKLDVARAAIERTKSDYIAAKVARLHEGLGGDRRH